MPRVDPRPCPLLFPPPPAAAAVVTHRPPVPLALPAVGLAGARWPGTGGCLLTAATAAMLAARPPHWGPHRAPASRGPRTSPDPGRGWWLGETILVWEGPRKEFGVCVLGGGAPREEGSWGGKAWPRRKGLI